MSTYYLNKPKRKVKRWLKGICKKRHGLDWRENRDAMFALFIELELSHKEI